MVASSGSKPSAVVVGTGFGCRTIVPALRAAGFEVDGLVGANPQRTQERAKQSGVPQAFIDLDAAITQTRAKLVVVATPPNTHAPLTMLAIERGCHVLCEKPFASDVAQARSMLDAAQRAGIVHFVGHEFRWDPSRALMARTIKEGLIGQPRFLTLVDYMPLVANPETKMPDWWFDKQAGGGWLGASGSHLIDQVRAWLGEFESLSATLPIVSAREGVAEDSYVLRFRLTSGVEGVMQQTAGAWGPLSGMTRVAGTEGTVWSEGSTVKLANKDGVRDLPLPEELLLPPSPEQKDGSRHLPVGLGPYTRLCEALRAAIDGRSTSAVPVPTFVDGLAEMEVLDAIRESADNNGALVKLR